MINAWISREYLVAAWTAELAPIANDTGSLVELLTLILRRGHHHGVFSLRPLDGAPVEIDAVLRQLDGATSPDHPGMLCAKLNRFGTVAAATMAHYDRYDQFRISTTTDLGALLFESIDEALHPQTFTRSYRSMGAPLHELRSGRLGKTRSRSAG